LWKLSLGPPICGPGQGKKLVGSWPQELTGIDATGQRDHKAQSAVSSSNSKSYLGWVRTIRVCAISCQKACFPWQRVAVHVGGGDNGYGSAVVTSLKTFDREQRKEYHIPVIIRDSGAPPISGTNTLTVVIGDGRHDDGRHWRRERQHSSSRTQTRAGIHLPRYSMTSSTDLLIMSIKMNDLDLCLEVVWGHANHRVTFATEYRSEIVRGRGLFTKDHR